MFKLVDTHNHLFVEEFTESKEVFAGAVNPAIDAGLYQMLICAGDYGSALRTQAAASVINAGFAAGIHPLSVNFDTSLEEVVRIRKFAEENLDKSTFSAIGEIGLDGTITDKIPMDFQEKIFSEQLKLARDLELPISVHVRGAVDLVAKHLRRIGVCGGVAHAFNGSSEQAKIFLKMGLKLGYGGAFTYDGSRRIRKLLSELPEEAWVLETDCPDMPSSERRKESSENPLSFPADILSYAELAAELRHISLEEAAEQSTCNAFTAFPRLKIIGPLKKVSEKNFLD